MVKKILVMVLACWLFGCTAAFNPVTGEKKVEVQISGEEVMQLYKILANQVRFASDKNDAVQVIEIGNKRFLVTR